MTDNENDVAEKLRVLIKKRASLKASLTRFQKKLDEATTSGDSMQISTRLERFENYLTEFETIQEKIEELEDNEDINNEERGSFEDNYYTLLARAKTLTNSDAKQAEANAQQSGQNSFETTVLPKIRLPQLDIPKFGGNYEDWRSFLDIFNSMVHNNKTISNAQKLLHLSDSLVGEAREVIKFLNITAENYTVARNLLIERYEKKQFIINAHIKALFDLPQMSKESPLELRQLISSAKQHLRSIEALQLPIQDWDPMIIILLKRKLDPITSRQWDLTQKDPNQLPKLKDLYDFLEQRCFGLEISMAENVERNEKLVSKKPVRSAIHLTTNPVKELTDICKLCSNHHNLYQCEKFIQQPIAERIKTVQSIGACFNCFRQDHPVRFCKTRHCKKCGGKHHTMIHQEKSHQQEKQETQNSTANNHVVMNTTVNQISEVLLATALIQIKAEHGKWIPCRTLLDSASQSNFLTQSLVEQLKCKATRLKVEVNGISQTGTEVNAMTNVQIKSRTSNFVCNLDCLIISNITTKLPSSKIDTNKWNLPSVTLADPTFNEPGTVDMLLGAEVYFDLMKRDQIKLGKNFPVLQNTVFGWVIAGKIQQSSSDLTSFCHLNIIDVQNQIERFWSVEEFEKVEHMTVEEQQCETHFQDTHYREETGRFVVKLPTKIDAPVIGDSTQTAIKRLETMERRMNKDSEFRRQYNTFMDEYQHLQHMTEVPFEQSNSINYLPHHAVFKDTSTTTKIRVVFDGSSKSSTGVSLNDTLLVGPKIQPDLFNILVRFRQHAYVISADIEKMYRQILIDPEDRRFQHILWRKNSTDSIKAYQLNTVTYGLASSPYLAIRCLKQLALEHQESFPNASKVILTDFYVDDLLTGGNTIQEVLQLKEEITAIMESGQFNLRKWISNDQQLMNFEQPPEEANLLIDPSQVTRTLGLSWQPESDYIRYSVVEEEGGITKRQVLSQIAKLFDPLGLLSPIILQAKIVMQQLWQLKTDWDHELPTNLREYWERFKLELPCINTLRIPRHVMIPNYDTFQIHAFADASEKGYGAAIYIRSSNKNIHVVRIICAKSRVAPLKKLSLPRLELCAALLAAKLCRTIQESITVIPNKIVYWCDSTITLHWINKEPSQLKTFVANRVAKLQSLTSGSDWRHIPTNENPADLVSRGVNSQQLMIADLWWTGPEFLKKDESHWPPNIVSYESVSDPETKTTSLLTTQPSAPKCHMFSKFSSWSKLVRVVAYCFRFINQARKTETQGLKSLTVEELDSSKMRILRLVQEDNFHDELRSLQANKFVKPNSNIKMLNPFIDQQHSVIRVGGRLKKSNIAIDQKHPIVLPAHHFISELILKELHEKLNHCGPEQMLAVVRLQYWPISGRNLAKKISRTCIRCFRYKPTIPEYVMADLPIDRVIQSRPFSVTGVDFAGPIQIREARRRGKCSSVKAYIAVFICFGTKAVHLELVSSLTTEAFLAALYRFISRRGICAKMFSDNGTNFVGANRELSEMYNLVKNNEEYITERLSQIKIKWNFMPPRAPHFGGIWEAAVKAFKRHFYKISHNLTLTFEECTTLITQIEAILNSRPLVPSSSDPNDLSYLSPSHFLIGDYLLEPPSPSYSDVVDNRLSVFQHIQKVKQHFWKRWSRDYLQQLQHRGKWQTGHHNIDVNTLVVLMEDNTPPLHWTLGRVVATHPGNDGVVRVVTVKTSAGVFKRPVKKLCVLPMK